MFLIVASAAFLFAVQDVPAQDAHSQESPAQETAAAAPDPNERVCRRQAVTGSMMRRTICHTRAQWDRMQEVAEGNIQRSHDQAGGWQGTDDGS